MIEFDDSQYTLGYYQQMVHVLCVLTETRAVKAINVSSEQYSVVNIRS